MNQNFTLPAFAEPITALPDTPQCPASELKRRLQAPAEELRQVHNALAETVEGITSATYPKTVTRGMLAQEVQEELESKEEQAALEAIEDAVADTLTEVQTQVAQKCEAYFGTYVGDGTANRIIELGFRPIAAVILCGESFFALKTQTHTCVQYTDVTTTSNATTENGLHVGTSEHDSRYSSYSTNKSGQTYEYIAWKA